MTTYRHAPSGLVRNTKYRVDTISGSSSAATVQRPNDDTPIVGSVVVSNLLGAGVVFEGSAATLYLKELGPGDVPTGTVVTSTGTAVVDPSPPGTPGGGLAGTGGGTLTTVAQVAADAALSGTYTPIVQLAASPDLMVTGAITRSTNGAATGFAVVWPDGATGTYVGTESVTVPGAIDSYTVTRIVPGQATKTFTQPTLTRDSSGAVTNRPVITVS